MYATGDRVGIGRKFSPPCPGRADQICQFVNLAGGGAMYCADSAVAIFDNKVEGRTIKSI